MKKSLKELLALKRQQLNDACEEYRVALNICKSLHMKVGEHGYVVTHSDRQKIAAERYIAAQQAHQLALEEFSDAGGKPRFRHFPCHTGIEFCAPGEAIGGPIVNISIVFSMIIAVICIFLFAPSYH